MAFVDSNETAVEGEDDAGVDFNFASWIAQNGLESMKDKLAEHGLTTPANINIQSKAFRALMSDAVFLASNGHLVPKLFAAIDAVSDYHDHQPSQNAVPTSPKQQRFIVYAEEEKVMDSIQHQIDELSCIESKTEALNDELSQSMQRIDQQKSAQIASAANKIAATFRELLRQMNAIKTAFVNDLRALQSQSKQDNDGVDDDDSKEDECQSSLSEYAQKNRDTKAYLEQQLAQCHEKMNTMLNDRRKERKQQIIEIGDQGRTRFDEIASEFEQHQGNVHRLVDDNNNTVVHIDFAVNEKKKQKMTRLVSKIGRIVNRQYFANISRGDESDNVDGDSDDALEATMEALRNQLSEYENIIHALQVKNDQLKQSLKKKGQTKMQYAHQMPQQFQQPNETGSKQTMMSRDEDVSFGSFREMVQEADPQQPSMSTITSVHALRSRLMPKFENYMTMDDAYKLQVGDKIDHRDLVGRFVHATVAEKRGTNVKIHYDHFSNKWDTWSDFMQEIHRFAKAYSISRRPAHRFKTLKNGDWVDLNPTQCHQGWKAGEIRRVDQKSGQVQVVYAAQDDKNYMYWTHVDNAEEIAELGKKTKKHLDLVRPTL